MAPRERRSVWGPRIAVLALLALAAGGLWLALRTPEDKAAPAPATTRAVKPKPKSRPKPKPRPAIKRLKLPETLRTGTVQLPILMYHRIDHITNDLPEITKRLTVEPSDFEAQMNWLHAKGYHPVTQRQVYNAVVRGKPLPRNPVLITFDDGYRDVLHYAVPILHRRHMPSTAYVITDRINSEDSSFFRWNELRRMDRLGVDIGSHTVSHPDLPSLSDDDALRELYVSRRVLEKGLKHPVQWFAYPAGQYDSRIVELVRRAGYVLAVTTRPGSEQDVSQPLTLNRYEILDSTGVDGLSSMLGS